MLRTKAAKRRHQLVGYRKALAKMLLREGDMLNAAQTAAIGAHISEIDAVDLRRADSRGDPRSLHFDPSRKLGLYIGGNDR